LVKKWLWISALVIVALVLLVAGALLALYAASQRVPQAYRQALMMETAEQVEGSDEMLQRATALASDVEREGQWSALFTVEQINGWLAVDLIENHADTLPPNVSDPRVAIRPDEVTVFCQFDHGRFKSVLSLSVDVYLSEPNVVAVRMRGARAGSLPLPLGDVLEQVTEAAGRWELPIRWRQAQGDPVALISLPTRRGDDGKRVELQDLRLGDGELYLAGSTSR
jgi:hypothetical protein